MTKYFKTMEAAKMELVRLGFCDLGNGYWVSKSGSSCATVSVTGHEMLCIAVSFGAA